MDGVGCGQPPACRDEKIKTESGNRILHNASPPNFPLLRLISISVPLLMIREISSIELRWCSSSSSWYPNYIEEEAVRQLARSVHKERPTVRE